MAQFVFVSVSLLILADLLFNVARTFANVFCFLGLLRVNFLPEARWDAHNKHYRLQLWNILLVELWEWNFSFGHFEYLLKTFGSLEAAVHWGFSCLIVPATTALRPTYFYLLNTYLVTYLIN